MPRSLLALLGVLAFAFAAHAVPSANDPALSIDPVVSGLTQPTALAFIGTDDFLVLEQTNGNVRRVTSGVLNPTAVLDLAVEGADERGLLGIAVHPDFAINHYVYLFYNPSNEAGDTQTGFYFFGYNNVVDRFTWDPSAQMGAGLLTFESNILTVHSDVTYHNGGSISFGPDGKLYGVIGDGGHNDQFTNGKLQNSAIGEPDDTGIVFRVNDDGMDPGDNFSAVTGMEKVFSYGLRNSFGLTWDPVNGNLWETENGEDDYDEVNRIPAGMNGGWADIMGPDSRDPQSQSDLFAFAGSAYSDPEFSWLAVVAPTGIAFGGSALGDYENDLFVGDYNNGFVYRFVLNAGRTGLELSGNLADLVADSAGERDSNVAAEGFGFGEDQGGGISDMKTGPDGALYVLSIGNGTVHKVTGGGGGPMTHDLSFTSLKPPKKVTFAPDPPVSKPLKASLQNQGSATETIADQGQLDDLLDVTVSSLGGCINPGVTVLPPKNGFPVVIEPNKKLSVELAVAWECINDELATTKDADHADYTLEASVDLAALGQTDGDGSDNACPRAPAGDDKGCGKTVGGAPFRVDLVLK